MPRLQAHWRSCRRRAWCQCGPQKGTAGGQTWWSEPLLEAIRSRPFYRWHIRTVLRGREIVYLNLIQNETAWRSRITAGAAAKLGRESNQDGCMHLKNIDGTDISVAVDVVTPLRSWCQERYCPPAMGPEALPVKGPAGLYTRKDLGEFSRRNWKGSPGLLRARRRPIRGVFCTDSKNIFIYPRPACCATEKSGEG
jgi:hypothetical protein